jgi:hypothetical protein
MIDPIPKAAVEAGFKNLSEASHKVLKQWNPLTLVLEQLWDKINVMSELGGMLARDGLKVHFVEEKPGYRRAQWDTPDPKAKAQAVKKLENRFELGSIQP